MDDKVANPNSWRVSQWRNSNRTRYNERQRELMRRRRARARELKESLGEVEKPESGV